MATGTQKSLRSVTFKATKGSDDRSLTTLIDFWNTNEVAVPIDENGNTILHFLAIYDNHEAIKLLRDNKQLKRWQLKKKDFNGDTALHEACRFGHIHVVKELLRNEINVSKLILLGNNFGETPIYVAAANGKKDVFDFLRSYVRREKVMEAKRDGCTVLDAAVMGQHYGFALSILESYPELGKTEKGMKALYTLASNKTAFKSGTMYNIKKLSSSAFVPWRLVTLLFYFLCVSPPVHVSRCSGLEKSIRSFLLRGYTSLLRAIPFFKEASEAKEKHVYANALAKKLVHAQEQWLHRYKYSEDELRNQSEDESGDESKDESVIVMQHEDLIVAQHEGQARPDMNLSEGAPDVQDPLIEAIKNNIMELVKIVLRRFPEAINTIDKQHKRNILHIAIQTKDTFMYEYLKAHVLNKEKMLGEVDCDGNSILHLASSSGEVYKNMSSPLIGVAWDVFWYKHIKQDTPRSLLRLQNSKGLTAKELFKYSHAEPLKTAAEAVLNVNNGLLVVSVLISTINFAAIFTIPGGFDQDSGKPVFFRESGNRELDLFVIYVGVSLLSSLIALGAQLSIQLSRFRKIDFYFVLPFKLFLATTALYYSTTFSITTCIEAYILEDAFHDKFFLPIMLSWFLAGLVYFDLVYISLNYLFFPTWYKFLAPPRQSILRAIMYLIKKAQALFGVGHSPKKMH